MTPLSGQLLILMAGSVLGWGAGCVSVLKAYFEVMRGGGMGIKSQEEVDAAWDPGPARYLLCPMGILSLHPLGPQGF